MCVLLENSNILLDCDLQYSRHLCAGISVQINCVLLCFSLKEQTLHFIVAFFFIPVGIVSSRIHSFILPESQYGVSLNGGGREGALLEISQEEPDVGLRLHSPE